MSINTAHHLRYWLVLLVSIIPLLISCHSNNKIAGGAPGETTNGVSLNITTAQGKIITNAQAYLYKIESMEKVDSAVSDSQGYVHFDIPIQSLYGVEIISQDSSQMRWLSQEELKQTSLKTAINNSGFLWISIDSTTTQEQKIYLQNTPYSTTLKNSKGAKLRAPQGTYTLVADSLYAGIAQVSPSTIDSIECKPVSYVPIENFNDGNRKPLFSFYWPSDQWWWWLGGDSTQSIFPINDDHFTDGITTENAFEGKSLHIQYDSTQWIGFKLGKSFDFTLLDSISIRLKGNGRVAILLEHIQEPPKIIYLKSAWEQPIDSLWTRVVYTLDSENQSKISNESWLNIRKNIEQFTIVLLEGNEVWIDDIHFYGIPLHTFTRP